MNEVCGGDDAYATVHPQVCQMMIAGYNKISMPFDGTDQIFRIIRVSIERRQVEGARGYDGDSTKQLQKSFLYWAVVVLSITSADRQGHAPRYGILEKAGC